MSRNAIALLAGVVLCAAGWLSFAPVTAVAEDVPAHEDQDDLAERLRRAEAEIEVLKKKSSSGEPSGDAQPDDSPDATTSDRWDFTIQELAERVNEYRDGLARNKYPNLEVHGAVQWDTGWYGQDATSIETFGILKDGAGFRRTRLGMQGSITPNVNYFWQMDFSFPGRPTFTDVWMEVTDLPLVGNIRAGQWKQPFSIEVVASYRYTMLPERSLLFQSFTPFRHPAIGFYDCSEDERMTWAASVYRSGQDQFGGSIASSGGYAGVARLTGLPWYEDEGRRYLHLGAAYNYVAPNGRYGGFRSIPEFFIGQNDTAANGTAGTSTPTLVNGTPFFVNTGNFFMNHYNLAGTELLWVDGPITLQSEFMYLNATRNNGLGAAFAGFYAQAGYFLTGEHRPYRKRDGSLDRIQVLHDFGKNAETGYGMGGVEVATRFSYVDLNSKDIRGGRLFDWTIGLNWYLNSYTKAQLEYIRAALVNAAFGDSVTNLYTLRLQWDF